MTELNPKAREALRRFKTEAAKELAADAKNAFNESAEPQPDINEHE